MAYQRQTFTDGKTKLKASHLKNMEDGIIEAQEIGKNAVQTVNSITPDENGNVQIETDDNKVSYYNTTREELGVLPEAVNSSYIWGLYDALMAEYPDKVQKNEIHNDDGTFTNYEYVISAGEYNTAGYYYKWYADKDIKKPKYLILSGIHGLERKAVLSAYRFIRDVLKGHNVPAQFREGCVIHIVPVGNPSGIDAFTRYNDNGVDVNRNFDWNWEEKDNGTIHYSGSSANSEKETQAIVNWLSANLDAELFIDCHNWEAVNEVVMIVGLTDNEDCDRAKKIALRGLDRVIPLWRDVIGYQPMETIQWNSKTKENDIVVKDPIFSQSISMNDGGIAIMYATDVLGITSLVLELSALQNGNYSDYLANMHLITPETISAGAEVIGNVLIEFYLNTSEVVDMTETNEKLDALTESMNSVSKGFRTESGVIVIEEDSNSVVTVRVPCSNGAKTLDFHADEDTHTAIIATQGTRYVDSFLGNFYAPGALKVGYEVNSASSLSIMTHNEAYADSTKYNNGWWLELATSISATNNDGVTFKVMAIKAGTYHWTAYYWND